MLDNPWFYVAAVPAMIILGLSKGGFTAVGLIAVPILALVISPVQAAGITLPVLVLSDIVAVIAYWGVFDRRTMLIMLPGAVVGVLIGWLTAAWVTESEVRLIVGLTSIAFALNWWFRHRHRPEPRGQDPVRGTFWSIVTGFTSFVSHAGGPPFQIYTLPLRLEPRVFAGTSVLLFAIINAFKTVPYFFLGQFDTENLKASAVLLPISIPATFVGVWLVKKVEAEPFYKIIYAAFFLLGIYLTVESIAAYV
ncbi:MAG: sulfite exporter TauE/SafE family protein [Bauldia sp.]